MEQKKTLTVNDQVSLFEILETQKISKVKKSYLQRLTDALKSDLDFHHRASNYASHNFHSFPAKFPPQLPQKFIESLTKPGDVVLDPIAGSGTTILEAFISNRRAVGFDIDPLAIKLARVKTAPLDKKRVAEYAKSIYKNSWQMLQDHHENLSSLLLSRFDAKTREFLDYWFLPQTQIELGALLYQINQIQEEEIRNFFEVIFSSIIITKSGGVSLALDLGHTRPHKTKVLFDKQGNIIYGESEKHKITKIVRLPLEEFKKKFHQNFNSLVESRYERYKTEVQYGDAQNLALPDASIDLIVTSPPYASNAIDYMRAHKFSLIWFGFQIEDLTEKRKKYIGSESTMNYQFEDLPDYTSQKVAQFFQIDKNRGNVLHRYYSEMTRTLREMYRVLKPQKAAIVVVGSSIMKGIDTETHRCLEDIGKSLGFIVPHIGIRKLDRNKRMLPAGQKINLNSQIQQRMHEEYVIGFYK
ncbi:site-specific DNA-methyltransferase [candidate division KSB1 bacterium]|nr:site-specific DNA-methyltransferase [candidate division KSB1 bacterium]